MRVVTLLKLAVFAFAVSTILSSPATAAVEGCDQECWESCESAGMGGGYCRDGNCTSEGCAYGGCVCFL